MKEIQFLKIIKNKLADNSNIGDDCAILGNSGFVLSQDVLVEDVHFSLKYMTPFQLAEKSIAVNLSDLASAGSIPRYISIGLSVPKSVGCDFVEEFYEGIQKQAQKYGFQVTGGDITSSEKIYISICAMGENLSDRKSSRSNAKEGDLVVTTGVHGSSACGLFLLQNEIFQPKNIIDAHISPIPKIKEGQEIASLSKSNFCMMDTSDGLADALYKIGEASNKTLEVDFDKIKIDEEIKTVAKKYNKNYRDWVLWGGEDYQLLITVSPDVYEKLDKSRFFAIGKVVEKNIANVVINQGSEKIFINEKEFLKKSFNHFEKEDL